MVYSTGIEKEIGALQLEVSIQALLYLYIYMLLIQFLMDGVNNHFSSSNC
jgi:hypothetical protein